MYISSKDWKNYIDKLSALDKKAGQMMKEWIWQNGFSDTDALIDYAYAVATKYGEGSAALSAAMYDAVAEVEGKFYDPAEVAPTPTRNEVAKTVNGVKKWSQNPDSMANAVSRLVKRTGADTTLRNAQRDGAEFAWVPNGDTCAFCITLASRGWQKISAKTFRNGHAEHIHANCDCTYAVRFDGQSGVKGYDPQKYEDMYYGADGDTPQERINAIRRMKYQENKDRINAQKREAYEKRHESKERVRSLDYAPEYERNKQIDSFSNTEELMSEFPEVNFLKGFANIEFESQKEIAQGFAHMKSFLGEKALPVSCGSRKMDDYGRTRIRTGAVTFNRNLNADNAFTTACHECIHVYDGKRGLISERLLDDAKRNIGYKTEKEKRNFDKLLLDLLGVNYYNQYKDDSLEILAYAYEEWLYGSDNYLVRELIDGLRKTRL